MEKHTSCVLLVSILYFNLISWTIGGTRIFYQMPDTTFSASHFTAWQSTHKNLMSIKPVPDFRQFNPQENLEYEDESESGSEEDDEDETTNQKEVKRKKSKFEKIDDFKLKIANKYLDKFLQIKTKVPPDLPEEAIIKVWGPVPDFRHQSAWYTV